MTEIPSTAVVRVAGLTPATLDSLEALVGSFTTKEERIDADARLAAIKAFVDHDGQALPICNRVTEIWLRNRREGGRLIPLEFPRGRPCKRSQRATLSDAGLTKSDSERWQKLAAIPDDEWRAKVEQCDKAKAELTQSYMLSDGKAHVARATGENEWYTPPEYIEAARTVMGGIDCDPASSEIANRTVKATTFYTKDTDGLRPDAAWGKRVWMNPPYAQPLIVHFAEALVARVQGGEVERACVLVNNATETEFFQRLLAIARAVCFPKGRIQFLDAKGKATGAPLQGQAILYIGGSDGDGFADAFDCFGKVVFA